MYREGGGLRPIAVRPVPRALPSPQYSLSRHHDSPCYTQGAQSGEGLSGAVGHSEVSTQEP